MPTDAWQKSSYCGEGEACIHVTGTQLIHLTESGDPRKAILTATPATFHALLLTLKEAPVADVPPDLDWVRAAPDDATGPGPWIELAFGADDLVYIRETGDPTNIVTTTQKKWDAFVLGVQAGEFDHFVEGVEDGRS